MEKQGFLAPMEAIGKIRAGDTDRVRHELSVNLSPSDKALRRGGIAAKEMRQIGAKTYKGPRGSLPVISFTEGRLLAVRVGKLEFRHGFLLREDAMGALGLVRIGWARGLVYGVMRLNGLR